MTTLERLRLEALEACHWRGHNMHKFTSHHLHATQRDSWCLTCAKQVTINSRPAPNEIDVGGEAVALNCE